MIGLSFCIVMAARVVYKVRLDSKWVLRLEMQVEAVTAYNAGGGLGICSCDGFLR